MSDAPMPRFGSARAAAARAPAGERRRTRADALRPFSDAFDMLLRDVELDAQSHRELERQIAEAERIADGIRAVFRGAQQPVHPPLAQSGGRAIW